MSGRVPEFLVDGERHDLPWRAWTFERAVSAGWRPVLEACVADDAPWVRHESFYRCHMADVDDRVPVAWRRAVASRLADLTGLDLVDVATVTGQRMAPGDGALAHTDAPQLGFEVVRWIVQLDDVGEGGVFHALDDQGEVAWSRAPRPGGGVVFAAHPGTSHVVTPTETTRRTVVFHAQHRANDARVAASVRAVFDGLRFDRLPTAVLRAADDAEASWPEDATDRAGRVAWALVRDGTGEDEAAAAYRAALEGVPGDAPVAWQVAAWAVRCVREGFDVRAWAALSDAVRAGWMARFADVGVD